MQNSLSLVNTFDSEDSRVDIVFIHGLGGDGRQTWMTTDNNEFWPDWLGHDIPKLSIYTLNYPATIFERWARREMDLYELATSSLEHMASRGLGNRPIILLARIIHDASRI